MSTITWQQKMKRMKLEDIKSHSPGFFEASGGYMTQTKPYSDKTTTGLTTCIIDYLKFKGIYAKRTGSAYQPHLHEQKRFNLFTQKVEVVSQETRWERSPSSKPGIEAIIDGRTVKIDIRPGYDTVKCLTNGDSNKELRITVRNMESFIEWFESTVFIQDKVPPQ